MRARVLGFTALIVALSLAVPQAQGAGAAKAGAADPLLAAADAARGDANGASWSLAVEDTAGGKTTSNALDVKSRGTNFLAEYSAPAAQKGQKLLQRDRNMWFVTPGASKPTPISPRQKLLGAASYGDIAATAYSTNYTAKALPDEAGNAVFDLTAKSSNETYDKIKLWVSKTDKTAIKAEFAGKDGKVLKTATYEYGNKGKSGGKFVSKMTITSGADKTTLTFSGVNFSAVPASTFATPGL